MFVTYSTHTHTHSGGRCVDINALDLLMTTKNAHGGGVMVVSKPVTTVVAKNGGQVVPGAHCDGSSWCKTHKSQSYRSIDDLWFARVTYMR